MLKFNKAQKLPKPKRKPDRLPTSNHHFSGASCSTGGVGFVQTLVGEGLVKVHVVSLHHEFSPIGLVQPPVVNPYTNQSPRNFVWK